MSKATVCVFLVLGFCATLAVSGCGQGYDDDWMDDGIETAEQDITAWNCKRQGRTLNWLVRTNKTALKYEIAAVKYCIDEFGPEALVVKPKVGIGCCATHFMGDW